MRKIISSIDIGSDSIKLVVGEFINDHLLILSATKVPSNGILNTKIMDKSALVESIKKATQSASNKLGIEINKVVLGINSIHAKLIKSSAAIDIKREDKTIIGSDISQVIAKCADGKVDEDYTLLEVIPVEFTIDGDISTKDPKGSLSEHLSVKAVVVTSSKEFVNSYMKAVEEAGIKVVDIIPNCLGDYYTFKDEDTEKSVGAVINLGNETTTISIFNKGIITNTKVYKMGAKNIINDIGYINRLDDKTSKAIYKDLALASHQLANPNEYRKLINLNGTEIKLNQYDLSNIAESRIEEILNLAKKQINILTKKEISYIIVLGGLTEIKDFRLTLENVFGNEVRLCNLNIIGARDNSFCNAIGILKYFERKVALRGKSFSIFTDEEIKEIKDVDDESDSNSLLDRVFGYFFDS